MENDISEDHLCPICLRLYYDPASPSDCPHVFCFECLNHLKGQGQIKLCPLCRKEFKIQNAQRKTALWKTIQELYPDHIKERQLSKQRKSIKIMVGNTSTQLHKIGKYMNYQWTLYVRPSDEEVFLEDYVDKVQVKLHPSFNPPAVAFKGNENIEVTRIGWGIFPISIKIFWKQKYGGFSVLTHDLRFVPNKYAINECKL